MAQGFYEILGIDNRSSTEAIHTAYHDQLAELVRRLRAARRQGADVTILEGQERSLKEAMQVLSDPVRRQRYDAYRRASRQGMPTGAESMWNVAKDSLVDPLGHLGSGDPAEYNRTEHWQSVQGGSPAAEVGRPTPTSCTCPGTGAHAAARTHLGSHRPGGTNR